MLHSFKLPFRGIHLQGPSQSYSRREIVDMTKRTEHFVCLEGRICSVLFALTHRRHLMHDCEINEPVQGLNKSQKVPQARNILLGSMDQLPPY